MIPIDATLPTIPANLAIEEAILELAEQGAWDQENFPKEA